MAKWQKLPAMTKRWNISWLPKFGCFLLKFYIFMAYMTAPMV